jgi:hypothetical protein
MKNRLKRAKRLLRVQSRLLLTERLELQTLQGELAQVKEQEQKAIALLNQEDTMAILPPSILVRKAASSAVRIKHGEALLEAQIEKTLDHARREQLVKKKVDSEAQSYSRHEMKAALQTTIDAYLSSRLKQE